MLILVKEDIKIWSMKIIREDRDDRMEKQQIRIGDVLVSYGYLSNEQIEEALALQKTDKGKRIGEILLERGFISEDQLLLALSNRLNMDIVNFENDPVDINAVSLIPKPVATKYSVIAISTENGRATLVVNDPLDFYAIEDVKSLLNMPCDIKLAKRSDIIMAIHRAYSEIAAKEAAMVANLSIEEVAPVASLEVGTDEEASPIVNLINSVMIKAYTAGASDVHIEPFDKYTLVRYRVDGQLVENGVLESKLNQHLSARIKILSGLDIAERRLPQDGHFRIRLDGKDINIRVSTMPTLYGEKIVMRFLALTTKIDNQEHYGMDNENYQKIQKILKSPYGIVYITGPTGSGKTTTLYSIIETMQEKPINISTIEDPVERNIDKVNQMQINTMAGLTFESGLKSILRQDPDVILVGETRDSQTAQIAIRAAVTGHLVLSTLHTNDAVSTILRLADMGVEKYLIANSVVGVVAQRLIKKICPYCKVEYEPDESELSLLPNVKKLHRGRGCHNCNFTGYKGRIAVHEILEIDGPIRAMISKNEPVENIYRYVSDNKKLKYIWESVSELVEKGTTSVDELIKNSAFQV